MAIGDVYEVVLRGRNNIGEAVYNVLHMRDDGGGESTLATNVLAIVDLLFPGSGNTGVDNLIANQGWFLDEFTTKLISPTQGPLKSHSISPTKTGRGGGGAIYTVAAVCKWLSEIGGRRARGRQFWGPIAEDVYTDGVLSSTPLGYAQAALNAVLAIYGVGGSSSDWSLGVWSKKALEFYQYASGIFRNLSKSQRRRQRGVGA